MRPALIRWTWRTSSPSSVGKRRCFPRRRAPAKRRPSSAESGGSKVFSVAMWAGPALRDRRAGDRLVERPAGRLHLGELGNRFLLVDAINVAVTRGGIVESRHRVHAVVVRDGRDRRGLGRPGPRRLRPLGGEAAPGAPARPATACRPRSSRSRAPRTRRGPSSSSPCARCSSGPAPSTDDLECGAEHGSRLAAQLLGQARGLPLPLRASEGGRRRATGCPEHPAPAGAPAGSSPRRSVGRRTRSRPPSTAAASRPSRSR